MAMGEGVPVLRPGGQLPRPLGQLAPPTDQLWEHDHARPAPPRPLTPVRRELLPASWGLAAAGLLAPSPPSLASAWPPASISREAGFILGLIYESRPGVIPDAVPGLIY